MSKLPQGVYLAFCPTGDGGGIDPTCSPSNKGKGKGKKKSTATDHWSGPDRFALAAYANEGYRIINYYLRHGFESPDDMLEQAKAAKKELAARARAAKKAGDENARVAAVREATPHEMIAREYPAFVKTNGIDLQETIDTLDRLIAASDTSEIPTQLYRGLDSHFAATIEVGQVLEDRGYVSTSTSKNVAQEFGPNLVTITTRKKAPRLLMNTDEAEVLLPRGSRLRVKSVEQIQHFRVFEMELL